MGTRRRPSFSFNEEQSASNTENLREDDLAFRNPSATALFWKNYRTNSFISSFVSSIICSIYIYTRNSISPLEIRPESDKKSRIHRLLLPCAFLMKKLYGPRILSQSKLILWLRFFPRFHNMILSIPKTRDEQEERNRGWEKRGRRGRSVIRRA